MPITANQDDLFLDPSLIIYRQSEELLKIIITPHQEKMLALFTLSITKS